MWRRPGSPSRPASAPVLACSAVSSQCTDSRSASGRWRCGIGFTPSRLQTSPPTRPRHDPLAASTAIPRFREGQACVHQHAVCISLPTGRGRGGAVLWWGTSPHYGARIQSGAGFGSPGHAARQIGPARDQLRHCHLRAGEEPPGLQLTLAVAAQPAQAHRFTRRHPFEDLRPVLSRRTSPNVPSDNSIAAPVGRLPQGSELYSRRVGQAKNTGRFRRRHYMRACPSAKAGMTRARRAGRAPGSGVGAVGKWPAVATAKSLAEAGHLSTAVVTADLR